MIASHQPTIFPANKVLAGVSSTEDGNMRYRIAGTDDTDEQILANRQRFLQAVGLPLDDTALVYVTFDSDHFTRFRVANKDDAGKGMKAPGGTQPADALATTVTGLGLFLPLADCNGLILYDEPHHALMVTHAGRHCTIEDGARKSVEFMTQHFGTNPGELLAWISPGVGQDSYAMEAHPSDPSHFNFAEDPRWADFRYVKGDKVFINLTGYNRNGFLQAGMAPDHIEVCAVDTATDTRYPSHSSGRFGRFAIAAALR